MKDTAIKIEYESVPLLEARWIKAIKENYDDVPVASFSMKQRGQLKNFIVKYREINKRTVWPYLLFVIENWDRIRSFKFDWLAKKGIRVPEFPEITFFIGFEKSFIQAYSDECFQRKASWLSYREIEIRKLRRLGFTRQQAEKEIEDGKVRSIPVERLMKEKAEVEKDLFIVSRERKQLRLENLKLVARLGGVQDELEKVKKLAEPEADVKSVRPKKKIERDRDGYAIFKG